MEERDDAVRRNRINEQLDLLKPCHRAAISHIRIQALRLQPAAEALLIHILTMSNIAEPPSAIRGATALISRYARIALHFHPDRPVCFPLPNPTDTPGATVKVPRAAHAATTTVARSLLADGVYRSQFETGISNGSVSAYPGGARDTWERALFDGAYHSPPGTILAADRPRYGALDVMRCGDGPAPRFGSCFFLLKSEVGTRATFTFGGSQELPRWRGVFDTGGENEGGFDAVLGQLFEECFLRDFTVGVGRMRPAQLMETIGRLEEPLQRRDGGVMSGNLDHFVEAQVHGGVDLARDVEMLVADPSFQGSETGCDLEAMSKKYGFHFRWHSGFEMRVEDVPPDFRGPTMPSLARRVAKDGVIDAEAIGRGVRDLIANPDMWADRGALAEVLQELKLLWHVLVRYGKPIEKK